MSIRVSVAKSNGTASRLRARQFASDQFDLWRLAIALTDADVIFCDSAMQAVTVRATKIYPAEIGARVYSFKETAAAIVYLEKVLT